MRCRILIVPVVAAALTATAPADLLPVEYADPASMTVSGGVAASLGRFSSDKSETELLTHTGLLPDSDKDGFLDVRTDEVNPTGYVVMHFARREHNVRVGFGGLLSTDIAVYAPPIRIGASEAPREPPRRWERLDSDFGLCEYEPATPLPIPEPAGDSPAAPSPVPEPASLLLLGTGALLLLRRR